MCEIDDEVRRKKRKESEIIFSSTLRFNERSYIWKIDGIENEDRLVLCSVWIFAIDVSLTRDEVNDLGRERKSLTLYRVIDISGSYWHVMSWHDMRRSHWHVMSMTWDEGTVIWGNVDEFKPQLSAESKKVRSERFCHCYMISVSQWVCNVWTNLVVVTCFPTRSV